MYVPTTRAVNLLIVYDRHHNPGHTTLPQVTLLVGGNCSIDQQLTYLSLPKQVFIGHRLIRYTVESYVDMIGSLRLQRIHDNGYCSIAT